MTDGAAKQESQAQETLDREKIAKTPLAVLPIKSAVVFPSLVMPLMISEAKYAKLIDDSLMAGEPIVLITQKDPDQDFPGPDGLYNVGTVGNGMYGIGTPEDLEVFVSMPVSKRAAMILSKQSCRRIAW